MILTIIIVILILLFILFLYCILKVSSWESRIEEKMREELKWKKKNSKDK
jgi:hypothetical protein